MWARTKSDADLDAALEHFQAIYEAGIIGYEVWQETSIDILRELEEWGAETDRLAQLN